MQHAYAAPASLGLAPVPTYHDLSRKIDRQHLFIRKLASTIETLGRELNAVRHLNHQLAKQPPPPYIDYTVEIPQSI